MADLSLPSSAAVTARPVGAARLWLAVVALLIVLLVPLAVIEVPPLLDYPNHLARAHILATIDQDPLLAARYQVTWRPLPNLAFDLLVPPLSKVVGIYTAGRIFLALSVVLCVIGPLVFHRALYGSYSLWPLSCGLLAYNGAFLAGFSGFAFGLGLTFLLTGLWLLVKERRPLLGLVVGMLFALIAYFTHLFALGLFGLIAFSMLFSKWLKSPRRWPPGRSIVFEALGLGLQFLPAILLFFAMTGGEAGGSRAWSFAQKLHVANFMLTGQNPELLPMLAVVLAIFGFCCLLRERCVTLPAGVIPAICILCLIWLALPSYVMDTAFVAGRFLLAVIFFVLASVGPGRFAPNAGWLIGVAIAAAIGLRVIVLTAEWQEAAAVEPEFRAALSKVEHGAVLQTAIDVETYRAAAIDGPGDGSHRPLMKWASNIYRLPTLSHYGSLAVIERSAFVPLLFTHPSKQLLQAHPDVAVIDQQQGLPWPLSLLQSEFTQARALLSGGVALPQYVLILHPPDRRDLVQHMDQPTGDRLTPLYSGRDLSLAGLLAKD